MGSQSANDSYQSAPEGPLYDNWVRPCIGLSAATQDDIQKSMNWREYHDATRHSVESLRRSRHVLDWANMPDPFRHYEGVPVLDLPADPPFPSIPALDALNGRMGTSEAGDGATWLSQLLFHSAAISATKVVPSTGSRYALRVNPSSGNLHPTEFHFRTRGLRDWPDGLYHYRPSSHMAEQRAVGRFAIGEVDSSAPLVFLLTSIAWREAWKYQARAYRYCLHDMGHAWQSLVLAARALGCESFAHGSFPDDEVADTCRLPGDEWPMLIVELRGDSIPGCETDDRKTVWFGGQANRLSAETVEYPAIRGVHEATKGGLNAPDNPARESRGEISLPRAPSTEKVFAEVARRRRSALDFRGGAESMTVAQLSAVLAAASRPLAADFAGERLIDLYVYLHRVTGVLPGVYRLSKTTGELELVIPGDQRVAAAGLSLGQDLAGNACVAFSMIGDLERASRNYGDRGYRYAHFEAGAIGQRLYLAAGALGMAGTGIGAFYDEAVQEYLGLNRAEGRVLYHFAIGYPVPDPRVEA